MSQINKRANKKEAKRMTFLNIKLNKNAKTSLIMEKVQIDFIMIKTSGEDRT